MSHPPITLEAYEAEALTALIRLFREGVSTRSFQPLRQAIEGRQNGEAPSRRRPFEVRAKRLAEQNAPAILIAYERSQADPRAWALEKLALLEAGDAAEETPGALESGLAGMCRKDRLGFAAESCYCDIAWWAGLNYKFPWDHPDDDQIAAIEATWRSSKLHRVLLGSTTFAVDGVPLADFASDREHAWHAREGLDEAIDALTRLALEEPPSAEHFLRSTTGRSRSSMLQEDMSEADQRRSHPALVASVLKCMQRVVRFHQRCAKRGWHVFIGGEQC